MNDILTLDQNASYNLRSVVTVTRRSKRTNKFGLVQFEQLCWETYQKIIKIQIV